MRRNDGARRRGRIDGGIRDVPVDRVSQPIGR
jgi:hypothetical protein